MKLLFIVGLPRSGTTWLLSFFENHPECYVLTAEDLDIRLDYTTKETGIFVRGFSDKDIINRIKSFTIDDEILDNDLLYVEKTPSHLFQIERIKRLFPESTIFLIERNILDIIYSMSQLTPWWRDGPETLEESAKLAKTFLKDKARVKPLCDYVIQYEDLYLQPYEEFEKIAGFLSLDTECIPDILSDIEKGKNLPKSLKGSGTGRPGNGKKFSEEEIERIIMA